MKILLDTCTFLWITQDSKELSSTAREIFKSAENEIFLSSVSAWEISVKYKLKKLKLKSSPSDFIPRSRESHGIRELTLSERSVLNVNKLPDFHNDPFDRMLVCQALEEEFVILTPDEHIHKYPVKALW